MPLGRKRESIESGTVSDLPVEKKLSLPWRRNSKNENPTTAAKAVSGSRKLQAAAQPDNKDDKKEKELPIAFKVLEEEEQFSARERAEDAEAMQAKMELSEWEAKKASESQECDELRAELANINSDVSKAEDSIAEEEKQCRVHMEDDEESIVKSSEKLRSELAEEEKHADAARQTYKEHEKTLELLTSPEGEQTLSKNVMQRQALQELEEEMEELDRRVQELSNSTEQLEQERTAISASVETVEQECASATRESAELTSELASASKSRFGLSVSSQQIDSGVAVGDDEEVRYLEATLHQTSSHVTNLKAKLQRTKQRGKEELHSEESHIRWLEEQFAELWCESMANDLARENRVSAELTGDDDESSLLWQHREIAVHSEVSGEAEEGDETIETTLPSSSQICDLAEIRGTAPKADSNTGDLSAGSSIPEDPPVSEAWLSEENAQLAQEEAELQAVLQQAQKELATWRSRISNKAAPKPSTAPVELTGSFAESLAAVRGRVRMHAAGLLQGALQMHEGLHNKAVQGGQRLQHARAEREESESRLEAAEVVNAVQNFSSEEGDRLRHARAQREETERRLMAAELLSASTQ